MALRQPSPIVGVAYVAQSRNLAMQRCINLYLETVETQNSHAPAALIGCPGLTLITNLAGGPIRALHTVEQFLYAVAGPNVYQVSTAFGAVKIGTLNTTSGPVSIIDNGYRVPGSSAGGQVAVSDSTAMWVWNGSTFALVAWPGVNPPGTLVFQDTFGLCNEQNTFNVWQSNISDLSTWNGLNFGLAQGSSDNIVTIAQMHRQIVILKERHIEFWINAGNAGFVFQRLDGVYPDIGCAAAASVWNTGDQIAWLGQDASGQGSVYMMEGYKPERVSSYAIEQEIAQYPTISDAVGWSYLQLGHRFYGLTFPSAGKTWVLDITATQQMKQPVWHERASFSNGSFGAYEPQTMTLFAGKVIAGSSTSGNLYLLDPNNFTDNGAVRKWLRSWRAHKETQVMSNRYNVLEIDMETGTTGPSANPQLVLRYTDDSHTWSHERWTAAGQSGVYNQRTRFRRLGMERRGLGNDRVFELSSTDPFKVALLGAFIS